MNLVTGASGILGSHVVLKLLQEGKPVIACKQSSSNTKKTEKLFEYYREKELFGKIVWKDIDITDVFSLEEAFEGIDHVYHCAGFVSFDNKDRKKIYSINEIGTFNIVTACMHKGVKALCHVSSVAAINNSDYKEPLHENVFWKRSGAESDYAISKYNGEREVWRGIEEGLNAVIVNPGVILSPGFWNQSSSKLFTTMHNGNSFYTDGYAGYVAAKDVASIMIELTEKKQFANRYIIVEGNYSYKHIFETIAKGLNVKPPTIKAGKILLQVGNIAETLISMLTGKNKVLSKALVNSSQNKQSYLNTKVKQTLSFKFTPIDTEILEICRFFKGDSA